MKKLFAVLIAFHLIILPIPRAHASGLAGMANQVRGMAIAGIGATILTTCPLGALSLSVKLFMAAGIVYLLGELAAGKSQKGSIEGENEKVDQTKGGRGGETQLATLGAQLKDKEEKKKVADKRALFTAASMALMTAAAIAAVTEIPRMVPAHPAYLPPLGCNPALAVGSAKLKAAAIGAAFSFLGGGGLTGGLITGIGIYALGLSALTGLLNLAPGRVKAFGALAAFTALALMDAKKESGKLSKEIADLKKVIAQFKLETGDPGKTREDTGGGLTAGVNGGVSSGSLAGNSGGSANGAITALPQGNVATTRSCISGNAEITSNCTNPLRVPALKSSDFSGAPEIQQVASSGVELANDLAMGNSGGRADIAAASIASSAAKLNDQLKSQLAKSNAFLKSKGEKPIDFNKDVADTMNSMNSSFQNEASKSEQSLASLGLSDGTVLDPSAASSVAQEIGSASTNTEIAVPTSDGTLAGAVIPTDSAVANTEAAKSAEASAKDALGNNLGDYETSDADISASKETSLWKQVSNRYLLKYERFFERKKIPAQ